MKEILSLIVAHCAENALVQLAQTCKLLSEAALDKIWEDPPVEQLAECIPEDVPAHPDLASSMFMDFAAYSS